MSLPRTQDIDTVLHADDGIFANVAKGTYIVDSSTISPIGAKQFAATAKKHDCMYIDSPMSGGAIGAKNGTLTFMVGADTENDVSHITPVLEAMGKKIFHCGGPGTGEIAKISNNLILGINMIACSEGLVLGEKLGIDPKMLADIISVSTGTSWANNVQNPRPGVVETSPASNNYQGGF